MADLIVEPALVEDLPKVLQLMTALADFEGYLPDFKVTQVSLKNALFIQRSFEVLVAREPLMSTEVKGIAVFYSLPFTYDLKPWILLKELVVDEGSRGKGLGKALMLALTDVAKQRGAGRIKWEVLKSNGRAQNFYSSLGAEKDKLWSTFCLKV